MLLLFSAYRGVQFRYDLMCRLTFYVNIIFSHPKKPNLETGLPSNTGLSQCYLPDFQDVIPGVGREKEQENERKV